MLQDVAADDGVERAAQGGEHRRVLHRADDDLHAAPPRRVGRDRVGLDAEHGGAALLAQRHGEVAAGAPDVEHARPVGDRVDEEPVAGGEALARDEGVVASHRGA